MWWVVAAISRHHPPVRARLRITDRDATADLPKDRRLRSGLAFITVGQARLGHMHILKGDEGETTPGTVLGHEAVGRVQEIGANVSTVAVGDRVVVQGRRRPRRRPPLVPLPVDAHRSRGRRSPPGRQRDEAVVLGVVTGGPAASLDVEVRCGAEEPQAPSVFAEAGQEFEDRRFVVGRDGSDRDRWPLRRERSCAGTALAVIRARRRKRSAGPRPCWRGCGSSGLCGPAPTARVRGRRFAAARLRP